MIKAILLATLAVLSVACGNDNDRLKEKSRMEGETLTSVENNNLAAKAAAMEKDLTRRHRFYQAVKGTYEGTLTGAEGSYKVRITMSPSLAPIVVTRTRQLEEIASDLNNLMMNTKASLWDPGSNLSSVSCIVSDIRPDVEKGEITIAKEGCQNFYSLKIADAGTNAAPSDLAQLVLKGDILSVQSIEGRIQPATNSTIYQFIAYKIEE